MKNALQELAQGVGELGQGLCPDGMTLCQAGHLLQVMPSILRGVVRVGSPLSRHYKENCYEHSCTKPCVDIFFHFLWADT